MWKRSLAVLPAAVALVALSGTAHADSAWATRSELGYVMARGNTDTESGNFKFDTAHAIGRWKYSFGLAALYANTNGIHTAQRWDAHQQTDLSVSDRSFWFAALRYEDDPFSGFAYQESFSTGAGRAFIRSDTTRLSAQLGLGVRRLRPELLTRNPDGAVTNRIKQDPSTDAIADALVTFEHSFTASTKVVNALLVESGQSNTMTKESLALQVKMNSTLALAVGWQLRSNSSPPPGSVKRTDTLMTINLVYELKNPNLTPTATVQAKPSIGVPPK